MLSELVVKVAIEPKTKADQEKMLVAFCRLAQDDPRFQVGRDWETDQTEISAAGDFHLENLLDRIKREFNVDADVGPLQVCYQETIRGTAEMVEAHYTPQTIGSERSSNMFINVEPAPGEGFDFVNKANGDAIPARFIPAIVQGLKDGLENGPLGRFPVVDVRVTLVDGKHHEIYSREVAFRVAASLAIKEALTRAKPVLLEPVFSFEVVTPDRFMTEVVGDLRRRRGTISNIEPRGGARVVSGQVPVAEMFGYATDLRSSTQDQATHIVQFDRYQEAPPAVAQRVLGHRGLEAGG